MVLDQMFCIHMSKHTACMEIYDRGVKYPTHYNQYFRVVEYPMFNLFDENH